MKIISTKDHEFKNKFKELINFNTINDPELISTVDNIISEVRKFGDCKILELSQILDNHPAKNFSDLELSQSILKSSIKTLDPNIKSSLEFAANRIKIFHERQMQESWTIIDSLGNTLGQKITPIDRVGIYVPGGRASYPSSVLMNAIPAKVAGVQEIIMVVPAPYGELNPLVLAAAYLSGVNRVFTIGGAQAIAALAYGTETIPKVDKITGPGNRFVAAAKRAVFGQVGVDMIAGPSEILVYAENENNPEWLAMDLLSQGEHDPVAQAIFITPNEQLLNDVQTAIKSHLLTLPKAKTAETSLNNRGALILTRNRQEAIDLINQIAPEHLQLCIDDAPIMAESIRHAGAIFMGRYTMEAVGDYCAGPNHVLPTSGTARFSSPLGVYDFQKRTSLIMCTEKGVKPLAKVAAALAEKENLDAHARSARYRL